jgi:hypothetical protein
MKVGIAVSGMTELGRISSPSRAFEERALTTLELARNGQLEPAFSKTIPQAGQGLFLPFHDRTEAAKKNLSMAPCRSLLKAAEVDNKMMIRSDPQEAGEETGMHQEPAMKPGE